MSEETDGVRSARVSRAGERVPAITSFRLVFHDHRVAGLKKSLLLRDAETKPRDACAIQTIYA